MIEIKANYGMDHVREWTEMKPPQREGYTPEGFPLSWEKIVSESDLKIPLESFQLGQTGMVENIIIPQNKGWSPRDSIRIIQKPE